MIWEKGKYFLIPWVLFFIAGLIAILIYGKFDLHIILNEHQPRSADVFFKNITQFGEGLAVGSAVIYLLFRSRYSAGFLASAWLSTFAIIQLCKQVIFRGTLRPASVFKDSDSIYFIEGVKNRMFDSFPSGHTGEIFSVCFALTLLAYKPKWGFIFFIPALSVAYSRVFLSQHFMEDILVGSFIAIFCTSVCFWVWWRNSPNFRHYINQS